MAAIDIGHLEGLPQPYSLGDLYTITMVINPPTNWELILQALMLPFFMNRQKYRLTKLRCWKWTNQRVASKRRHFGCFFLMLPARVSCKKKWGNNSTRKTPKKVFFCSDECFFCVSQESSPNFSVWNSPTRSLINGVIINGVIDSINGLTLLLSASPFTTSFSWPTLYYQCFARKFGLQDSVEWPKCCRTFPNTRGGSAVLLQVLGNSQYQDRGLASDIYVYMQLPGTQMTSLFEGFFLPKQGRENTLTMDSQVFSTSIVLGIVMKQQVHWKHVLADG